MAVAVGVGVTVGVGLGIAVAVGKTSGDADAEAVGDLVGSGDELGATRAAVEIGDGAAIVVGVGERAAAPPCAPTRAVNLPTMTPPTKPMSSPSATPSHSHRSPDVSLTG